MTILSLMSIGGIGKQLLRRMEYRALSFVQRPIRSLFWLIEQHKARLRDHMENEISDYSDE